MIIKKFALSFIVLYLIACQDNSISAISNEHEKGLHLSGKIFSTLGEPLNGVLVFWSGSNAECLSDSSGSWELIDSSYGTNDGSLNITQQKIYFSQARSRNNIDMTDTISSRIRLNIIRTIDKTTSSRFVYGFMTDLRDNKIYRYITVRNKLWLAQNLEFKTGKSVVPTTKYGLLYSWSDAMGLPDSCRYSNCIISQKSTQGICPQSWRIPDSSDWAELINNSDTTYAAKNLRSASRWANKIIIRTKGSTVEYGNGVDAIGFNALPAIDSSQLSFWWERRANWWTTKRNSTDSILNMRIESGENQVEYFWSKSNALSSLRCVHD